MNKSLFFVYDAMCNTFGIIHLEHTASTTTNVTTVISVCGSVVISILLPPSSGVRSKTSITAIS